MDKETKRPQPKEPAPSVERRARKPVFRPAEMQRLLNQPDDEGELGAGGGGYLHPWTER